MNLITASLADEYCLSHSATKLAEQPSEKWELAEFEPYSRHWDFVSLSYADDICLASWFVKLRIWKCECLCPRKFRVRVQFWNVPFTSSRIKLGVGDFKF